LGGVMEQDIGWKIAQGRGKAIRCPEESDDGSFLDPQLLG
jgi:hypothetical protein